MPKPFGELHHRIRELVGEAGAIRSRDAYAILLAEGWTRSEIDAAKRRAVNVCGITQAAWWRAKPKPLGKRWRSRREKPEVPKPPPPPPAPPGEVRLSADLHARLERVAAQYLDTADGLAAEAIETYLLTLEKRMRATSNGHHKTTTNAAARG